MSEARYQAPDEFTDTAYEQVRELLRLAVRSVEISHSAWKAALAVASSDRQNSTSALRIAEPLPEDARTLDMECLDNAAEPVPAVWAPFQRALRTSGAHPSSSDEGWDDGLWSTLYFAEPALRCGADIQTAFDRSRSDIGAPAFRAPQIKPVAGAGRREDERARRDSVNRGWRSRSVRLFVAAGVVLVGATAIPGLLGIRARGAPHAEIAAAEVAGNRSGAAVAGAGLSPHTTVIRAPRPSLQSPPPSAATTEPPGSTTRGTSVVYSTADICSGPGMVITINTEMPEPANLECNRLRDTRDWALSVPSLGGRLL